MLRKEPPIPFPGMERRKKARILREVLRD